MKTSMFLFRICHFSTLVSLMRCINGFFLDMSHLFLFLFSFFTLFSFFFLVIDSSSVSDSSWYSFNSSSSFGVHGSSVDTVWH